MSPITYLHCFEIFIFLLLAGYETRTIYINACLPCCTFLYATCTVLILYLKLKIYTCSLTCGRSILRLTSRLSGLHTWSDTSASWTCARNILRLTDLLRAWCLTAQLSALRLSAYLRALRLTDRQCGMDALGRASAACGLY
jgi:hypothetical protein